MFGFPMLTAWDSQYKQQWKFYTANIELHPQFSISACDLLCITVEKRSWNWTNTHHQQCSKTNHCPNPHNLNEGTSLLSNEWQTSWPQQILHSTLMKEIILNSTDKRYGLSWLLNCGLCDACLSLYREIFLEVLHEGAWLIWLV